MTTLQYIIAAIRSANIVDPKKVNFGYTDLLIPPYISVMDFVQVPEFVTNGISDRTTSFTVTCIASNSDEADALAEAVNNVLNMNASITPNNSRCLQVDYMLGQLDTKLYQFGGVLSYTLFEGF